MPAFPTAPRPSGWQRAAVGALLVALVAWIYWPVRHHNFVGFDDPDFVTANPVVQKGLTREGFRWVWTSEVARNWHPVTMLSHMADCQLFGLNPGPPHLVNAAIHASNTLLLLAWLSLATGSFWRPAFVAAVFAVHPLHVESVAWLAERKDVLSTFFWFLVFYCHTRHARAATRQSAATWFAAALGAFALGLMSKPMLVTCPFVLLLLDYWPLARFAGGENAPRRAVARKLILEKIPFLVLSAALCVVTYLIQDRGGAMQAAANLPLTDRLENSAISAVRYIWDLFVPVNLCGLYLHQDRWPFWQAAAAAAALLGISAAALIQRRRRPWFFVGWFWYLGVLVPVIGWVQVGMQTRADRFTYVSMIGLLIVIAWGAVELIRVWRWPAAVPAVAGCAALAVMAPASRHQVGFWKDSETLFGRMISVNDKNFIAHYNLGNYYAGRKSSADAEAHYRAALAAEPNYADAHANYGGLLLEQKRYDESLFQYRAALRLQPRYLTYLNLANTLADTASARHDDKMFEEASTNFAEAVKLNPAAPEPHNNWALSLQAQGREPEAAAEFREAVRLNPQLETAWFSLAEIDSRAGRAAEAASEYAAAAALNPKRLENLNGLGVSLAMKQDWPGAEAQFKTLLRLQPTNGPAWGNLGNVYSAESKFNDASNCYAAALRLDPNDYQSEFNLGLTLSLQGQPAQAVSHMRRSLAIHPDYPAARAALADLEKRAGGK